MNINYYNIELTKLNKRYLIGLIIVLVLILLFIKNYDTTYERIVIFMTIFILILIISKNLIISIVLGIILFLMINLLMNSRIALERFQNENEKDSEKESEKKTKKEHDDEPAFDKNIFESETFKNSTDGIQELLKKVNGGIELKEDDLKETDKLGVNVEKYSDDKKHNALKQAQKEAYELIDTVNALKDTVNTLSPVLSEGKKLMDMFQNLKI